jgi:hypothetical protein
MALGSLSHRQYQRTSPYCSPRTFRRDFGAVNSPRIHRPTISNLYGVDVRLPERLLQAFRAMLGVGHQVEREVLTMDTLCLQPLLRDTNVLTQTQLLHLQFLAALVSLRWLGRHFVAQLICHGDLVWKQDLTRCKNTNQFINKIHIIRYPYKPNTSKLIVS